MPLRRRRSATRPAAFTLLCSGLSLGSLSILAAHPVFSLGMWSDSEPMTLVFHIAAVLCLVGLGLALSQSDAPLRSLGHPIVVAPAVLGAWSLMAAPWVDFPALSILGPPENGLGALWFLEFAAFAAAGLTLRASPRWFRLALMSVAVAALTSASFNLWRVDWPNDWRPWLDWMTRKTLFEFNEYQAYYALSLLAAAPLAGAWQSRRFGWCLATAGLLSLLVSRNRAAMIAIAGAGLAVAAVRYVPWLRAWSARLQRHRVLGGVLIAIAIAGIAATSYAVIRLADLRDIAPTLASRRVLFEGIEPSLLTDPWSLIIGHGWGRYADFLSANLTSAGIQLFDTNWGGLGRDFFHSHHSFLEALFAAGLPGLVVTLALPAAVAIGARRRWRDVAVAFALSWALVDSLWFMMPATIPAIALASAALADGSCRFGWRAWPGFSWAAAPIMLAALVLVTDLVLFDNARSMTRLSLCLGSAGENADCSALGVPHDPRGTEVGFAALLAERLPPLLRTGAAVPDGKVKLVRRVLAEAERRDTGSRSLQFSIALADTYAAIAFAPGGAHFMPEGSDLTTVWTRALHDILRRAPQRVDLLAAYFNWLLLQRRSNELEAMLVVARKTGPDHPVVQWFWGVQLLVATDPKSREEGLSSMRRALAAGLERFMPVDAALKAQLAQATGEGRRR